MSNKFLGLDWSNPFKSTAVINGLTNLAGSTIGSAGYGLISDGLNAGVGNAISNIGSTVGGIIPGPWGAAISAGTGIIGGLFNRAFGSDINEGNVAQVEANINALNSFTSNALDNDTLMTNWANAPKGMTFSDDFIGKDGWFSDDAEGLARELRTEVNAGVRRVGRILENNMENIKTKQIGDFYRNYSAFGGPLGIWGGYGDGVIGYELAKENLGIKALNAASKKMLLTSKLSSLVEPSTFANGGKIRIKPENEGKFTKYCGGKVTSECIARGKRSSDSAIRKRATFADNARKWHHAFGGNLITNGAEWDNGITIIGNGGTHGENPMGGVQVGVDYAGTPNLVEEGEVIFNDYVFSNRLNVPKDMKQRHKLKGKKLTFAQAAKQLQRESEERPNDPISRRGLLSSMSELQQSQEEVRAIKGSKKSNLYFDGSWLRYAPVIGSIIGIGQDMFSSPDYSNAEAIEAAANEAAKYIPVSYTPISNYLQYKPFDRNFYLNKLNAQAAATRRAIMDTSSPSRNAALIAADYNAQIRMGDLARQAEEYNLAQRQAVETFNRGTKIANAEMGLKAAMANQQAKLNADKARLSGISQGAAMRENIDASRSASMSANLSNLFESLGNIGIDALNRKDRDNLIKSGVFGVLPGLWAAEGGKLRRLRKKRGGLTY